MTDRLDALLADIADMDSPAPLVEKTGENQHRVTISEHQRTLILLLADLHGLGVTGVNRGTGLVEADGHQITIETQPRLTDRARAYALALHIAYDMTIHMPQRGTLTDHAPAAGRSVRTLMERGEFGAPIQLPTLEMETLASLYSEHAASLLTATDDYEAIAKELTERHAHLIEQSRA